MNLILFDPGEWERPLPRHDARAVHLLEVLRRKPGDAFDAGITNGPRGKGRVESVGDTALALSFTWEGEPPPLAPIEAWIALPRPQTARKVLQESASLGVRRLVFFPGEKGEPSYAASTLWSSGEWRRHLMAGAAQAFDTRLPDLVHYSSLKEALARETPPASAYALDNYEAAAGLGQVPLASPVLLAFGPERGWSRQERDVLREGAFTLAHLGSRVLRTETALIAAVSIVRSRMESATDQAGR